ncbi:MAG: SpvB/TcaC N-terminal domain-containing protein [Pseudomonadota bacterium]
MKLKIRATHLVAAMLLACGSFNASAQTDLNVDPVVEPPSAMSVEVDESDTASSSLGDDVDYTEVDNNPVDDSAVTESAASISDEAAGEDSGKGSTFSLDDANASNLQSGIGAASATASAASTAGLPAPLQSPSSAVPTPESYSGGSYAHRVTIDVPRYHGIEPNLAILYNSSQRIRYTGSSFGLLGAGSQLSGLSVIDRARPKRGVPKFELIDTYLLNGAELMKCADAAYSPSCDETNGNYTSRVESYKKIRYEASNGTSDGNTWTVVSRNGTKYTYRRAGRYLDSGVTPTGQDEFKLADDYRWLLDRVTNTNGRFVEYDYNCLQIASCRPSSITYGPYRVFFYYEDRPDIYSYGTGAGLIQVRHRLSTIEVRSNGIIRHAYKLSYENSSVDRTSRLVEVQKFGRNATITNGVVQSGSSLPPTIFALSDGAPTWTAVDTSYDGRSRYVAGDFDGDGKDEIAIPLIASLGDCRIRFHSAETDQAVMFTVMQGAPQHLAPYDLKRHTISSRVILMGTAWMI